MKFHSKTDVRRTHRVSPTLLDEGTVHPQTPALKGGGSYRFDEPQFKSTVSFYGPDFWLLNSRAQSRA